MTQQKKSFNDFLLHPELIDALNKHNLNEPTTIQEKTIPAILEGKDVLGSAPTGTGKTLAFLLPIFQYLFDFPRKKSKLARILILVPTRELALQINNEARKLVQKKITINLITGGVPFQQHDKIFNENQDIIIATTGRLLQYLHEDKLDLSEIEMLILDEADRMLDMGFKPAIEQIAYEIENRKQTLLFSATLKSKEIHNLAQNLLSDPIFIETDPPRKERKKITQFYYYADDLPHKIALLLHLLKQKEVQKTVIFVKKRERVHELVSILQSNQLSSAFIEGDLDQTKRQNAISRIQKNKTNILISTDVSARGIDIAEISHVINFDLPKSAEIYLHRIGRTARAGNKGTAISLVEAHDFPLIERIERYLNIVLKQRKIDELRPKTALPKFNTTKKSKKKTR